MQLKHIKANVAGRKVLGICATKAATAFGFFMVWFRLYV